MPEMFIRSFMLCRRIPGYLSGSTTGTRVIYYPRNFFTASYYPAARNKYSAVVNFIDERTIVDLDNEKCTMNIIILIVTEMSGNFRVSGEWSP